MRFNYIQVTFFRALITGAVLAAVMLVISVNLFKVKNEHFLLTLQFYAFAITTVVAIPTKPILNTFEILASDPQA